MKKSKRADYVSSQEKHRVRRVGRGTEDDPELDLPQRPKPHLVPEPRGVYRNGERVLIAESPRTYRTIVVSKGVHVGTLTRPETIQLLALGSISVGPVMYSVSPSTQEET